MTTSEWPQWLKNAQTTRAVVTIQDGQVIWEDGIWKSGTWQGGTWKGGIWEDGIWKSGTWQGGIWEDGIWKSGTWQGGIWKSGTWQGGTWKGGIWKSGTWKSGTWQGGTWEYGTWQGGTWQGGTWEYGTWQGGTWKGGIWKSGTWKGLENRLYYLASLAGITRQHNGMFLGFRTTHADGSGRYTSTFHQPEGHFYENAIPPTGAGTCTKGIHVTSAARAWTYFGIDPACQMWSVEFTADDLLDCDGEKARIRGGYFRKIDKPF